MTLMLQTQARTAEGSSVIDIGNIGIRFRRPPVNIGIVGRQGMVISETPVTWAQVRASADKLGALTHGALAMHLDGTVYVTARGPQENPISKFLRPVARAGHVLSFGQDSGDTLRKGAIAQLIPTDADEFHDPRVLQCPAHGSYFLFASLAAFLTDRQSHWFVRLPTEAEWEEIVSCGSSLNYEQIINLAPSNQEAPMPVTGDDAEKRRSPWGLIDGFGNGVKWLGDVFDSADLRGDKAMDQIRRVQRGAVHFFEKQDMRVPPRWGCSPNCDCNEAGAFLVAVPR